MNSKTRRVLGVTVCLVLALVFGVSQSTLWSQEDNAPAPVSKVGVDMQILSFENKGELQAYMKSVSEALGVGCKFCHDITAFEKNPEGLHKGAARGMMKMMNEINTSFFKESDSKLTCYVCHRGREHPVFSKAEYEAILKESEKEKSE